MKSALIGHCNDQENYTKLMVLKSPAGYYIGTIYEDPAGFQEPGSRDSDYFDTRAQAETFLYMLESGDPDALGRLRDHL